MALTSGISRPRMIAAVALRLLYLMFQQMLRLTLVMGRTAASMDIELLVSRHELAVLRRTKPDDPPGLGRPSSPRLPMNLRVRCLSPQERSCGGTATALWARVDLPEPLCSPTA